MVITIKRHKSRIDAAFDRVDRLPPDELRLRSHFAEYLTVLVYGYLEQSVKRLLMTYVDDKAAPPVARYTNRRLERTRSMKYNNLIELLTDFDPQWRIEFENVIKERSRRAIDTVTNNRHRIAHGQSTSMTVVAIKREYEQIKKVIDNLTDLLKGAEI